MKNLLTYIILLIVVANIFIGLYYWFNFLPYCYRFGGSCNAGVIAIYLLPIFIGIALMSLISIISIFKQKKKNDKSKLATILLSICLFITIGLASTTTDNLHLLSKTIIFYLPLTLLLMGYLILNFIKLK